MDSENEQMILIHSAISYAKLTCIACPEQWEGLLNDGKFFYFRYRHGVASLSIGRTLESVRGHKDAIIMVSNEDDGIFESHQQRNWAFTALFIQLSDEF